MPNQDSYEGPVQDNDFSVQALELLQIDWLLHIQDGLDLFEIHLNPSLMHYEARELVRLDSEGALGRVQLHAMASHDPKCLEEVLLVSFGSSAFDKHVVNVNFHFLPDLPGEHLGHHSLINGPNIL